ncbi:zinc metalloprotease HtpX [Schaalia naturae]|uniref:Protease HtpX homolog n=1 Tax=Schaalia naturae TaxID=635203 RepID=A0ABW2SIH1_9ACTO
MGHRYHNGLKTAGLFLALWAVLLVIGWLIAQGTGNAVWIGVFAVMGLASTAYSYWNSATLALRQMRARQVGPTEQPVLYAIVTELSQRAGQPMPTIWVAPTHSPNAFATGRDPDHAAVCCTEGILAILGERELRAVLGHELMHVYNRDILTSSVASAIGGLISSIAQFLMFFGGGRNREGGGMNALAALATAILAPIAATLIQLSISRTREFDADENGAQLAQDPLALASALRKIEQMTTRVPMEPTPATENVAAMMIANPFRGRGVQRLFSTHPPMEERIARLEKMAGY